MKKIFFEAVHNVIAHPLLSVGLIFSAIAWLLEWPLQWAEKFHDWTARRM